MKRILITGGTGFFGKSILDYFAHHPCDCQFHTLSRHEGDIVGDVRTFCPPDGEYVAIIHAAALLNPSASEADITSITVDGTRHVIDVARQIGCNTILYPSSGAVYGHQVKPSSETTACKPISAYAKAKLAAESLLLESGLDVKIARCFAFVGKHLDRSIYYAIGNFIADALAGRDIVIRGDGTPMRSYMHADDLVEWLWAILERGESGRVYNVGSDEAISIRDLAHAVRDALGSKSEVKVLGQSVAGAADYYVPDVSRIRRELGVELKITLRNAILDSI